MRKRKREGRQVLARLETAGDRLRLWIWDGGYDYPLYVDPLLTSPSWTTEGDQISAYFGASVGTAGDVNGDGYDDLIVGAPNYDNGQTNEGRVFVYCGSASGPSITADWTAESNVAGANLGQSAATAGDVNGDGYDDVIVGAPGYMNKGMALAWYGGPTGLGANGYPGNQDWFRSPVQSSTYFGYAVGSAGDVNGDGYDDVIIGAYGYDNEQTDEGRVYVFYGSAGGLGSTSWTAESDQNNARLGISAGTAGDVNGDGYDDVIAGAYYYDNGQTDEGKVFAWYGGASGLGANGTPVNADWSAESDQASAYLGMSVSTAGDVNGDGYDDVIIGAHGYDNDQTDEGRAYVYHGSVSGLSVTANWTAESDQASAYLGRWVAAAGDVDRDGYADVLVGAYAYDNGQTDEGKTFAWYGGAGGLGSSGTPVNADWSAEGNQAGARFGLAAGTAGDVNHDQYDDVVIGADKYDNGQTDEGKAFAYLSSGVSPATVRKYYYFGGQRIAMRLNGVLYYLVGDHLGTTSLVLNAQGNVVSEARHYPYGEERWHTSTLPTDYRFTGQAYDSYIKLYAMGARQYDPELGRWISPDTIIPDPANPQSLNRYSYVNNRPLVAIDPTGHDLMIVGGMGGDMDPETWKDWIMAYKGWSLRQWEDFYKLWNAATDFASQNAVLAAEGIGIFTWGGSSIAEATRNAGTVNNEEMLDDLSRELEGMADITLVGWSKGGNLVMRYLQELDQGAKLTQIKHAVLIAPADTPLIRLHPDIGLEGARVPQIGVNMANICAKGDWRCHMRLPGTINFNTGLMGHGPHGPIARQAFAALCVANDRNAWSEPNGWR